ncbi:haloacid dehalogenase-like hydrolase, partial [Escherichia coli]|uniref:haloacid dehalogenase-like hydrolase n=1 Tax=Escherichia coli TaxID=562 RepID=UPI001FCF22B4
FCGACGNNRTNRGGFQFAAARLPWFEPWCDSHGVELICSSLQQSDGILTGRYEGRQCVLTEKARLVRERYDLATYPTIYAYGDTPEDLDMLAIATKQYYQWQEVGVAGGR